MRNTKAAQRLFETLGEPVDGLEDNEFIGKIAKPRGNSLYEVEIASADKSKVASLLQKDTMADDDLTVLVVMPPKFRNTIFVKRGGFVVIQWYTGEDVEADAKVKGEIANIVTNKKDWQKMPYWPADFKDKEQSYTIDFSDEEEDEDDYEGQAHDSE